MPATPELTIRSVEFRRERESSWRELEQLIELVESHGVSSLNSDELERFPLLYRSALSSLSVARAIALDRALVAYLDNLAVRAFLAMYGQPLDPLRAASHFIRAGFPQAVRTLWRHVAIALFVFLMGLASGFLLLRSNEPYWFAMLVPSDLAGPRTPASTAADLHHVMVAPVAYNLVDAIGNALFAHNTYVALLVFGLGFLGGIPTILLTLHQGLILGAFLELHVRHGLGLEFTGWVSIHGVTEIIAFLLFAAAGLRLGEILIFSKDLSRVDAFAINGPVVAKVATGAGAMLLVAAVIEGYFRQAIQNTDWRLAIASATLVLWVGYLSLCGRRE